MADIFLSYASEDREAACLIAQALESQSWTVWWDRKIPAGQAFDEVIEREIGMAKSVVVLWSKNSTKSEWVKNEAAAAVEHDKMVPVQIDDAKLPLEFRRRQTLNLADWTGDTSDPRLESLFNAVSSGSESQPSSEKPSRSPAKPERSRSLKSVLILLALGASGLGAFLYYQAHTIHPIVTAEAESQTLIGTWTHSSGVFWLIAKDTNSRYTIRQTDPDKGLTMRGTAVRIGDEYKLDFEVLPAPVVKGKAKLTLVDGGSTLNVNYESENGDVGKLVFRR